MIPNSRDEMLELQVGASVFYAQFLTGDKEREFSLFMQLQSEFDKLKPLQAACSLVDIFIVDWKGEKLPKRDKEKKPSQQLLAMQLIDCSNVLTDHIEDLTGLSVEETKN
jgi:hypothetical protein